MAERLIVGSDHAGITLRKEVVRQLLAAGHEVKEVGPAPGEKSDYPDEAQKVAEEVAAGQARFGIAICGTGIGVSIAANKVRGIRAAVCTTEFEARMARAHNDANVLCMGERVIGLGLCAGIVDTFLCTRFEGGRHAARVAKISALER